jgi:hypothetical protein
MLRCISYLGRRYVSLRGKEKKEKEKENKNELMRYE